MEKSEFRFLVKRLMEECNLRQVDLAEVLEVSIDRVKSLSSGKVKAFTRDEGEKLIRKLNIRAEWLATNEGPIFRSGAEVDRDKRLADVAASTQQAGLSGLTREEQALVAMLLTGLEQGNAVMVRNALDQHTPQEHKLIDWYRAADGKGKKAIEATAKALAGNSDEGR
jgi:DNA-binding Xre family transcriptional regulator